MLTISRKNNETHILLGEKLDVGNIVEFYKSIKKVVNRKSPIVFDTSNVSRLHSANLQVLLALVHELREKEHSYRWLEPSEQFQSAVATLGLEKELGLING